MRIVLDGVKPLMKRMDPKLITASYVRALNRTATTAVKEVTKAVIGRYNILAKDFKATSKVKKATKEDPVAVISFVSSPIPLYKFKAKPVKVRKKGRTYTGVSAKVLKKGRRSRVKGAFPVKKGTHIGAFRRVGKSRYPIMELKVFSPTTMIRMVDGEKLVDDVFNEHFVKRFVDDYRYRLEKVK